MSENVAIIPARGGSKGVPRKNVRRVGGIPLIARAVAAATRAETIDRIVVTTDDADIAALAAEWGAEIVERPAEIAGDTASSESALLHALDVLEERGIRTGVVAFLQATSPFIDHEALDEAVRVVRSRRRDCVFSAVATYGFLWARGGGDAAVAINHEAARRPRRQDREPHYLETGAFYVMRAAGLRTVGHRFFGSVGVIEVPDRTAIEIDTEADLALARAIAPLVDVPEPIDVDAVVTDFDGVHTDDTATVDQDGREAVVVSRSDGWGVAALRRAGVPVAILSAETNPVVSARAAKLGVEARQGLGDKESALREWAAARAIPLSRIAYLGNDAGDLACLDAVGWPIAVPDAHPSVLAAARIVLDHRGGHGAVRELSERVLAVRRPASVRPAPRQEST